MSNLGHMIKALLLLEYYMYNISLHYLSKMTDNQFIRIPFFWVYTLVYKVGGSSEGGLKQL